MFKKADKTGHITI